MQFTDKPYRPYNNYSKQAHYLAQAKKNQSKKAQTHPPSLINKPDEKQSWLLSKRTKELIYQCQLQQRLQEPKYQRLGKSDLSSRIRHEQKILQLDLLLGSTYRPLYLSNSNQSKKSYNASPSSPSFSSRPSISLAQTASAAVYRFEEIGEQVEKMEQFIKGKDIQFGQINEMIRTKQYKEQPNVSSPMQTVNFQQIIAQIPLIQSVTPELPQSSSNIKNQQSQQTNTGHLQVQTRQQQMHQAKVLNRKVPIKKLFDTKTEMIKIGTEQMQQNLSEREQTHFQLKRIREMRKKSQAASQISKESSGQV